MKNSKKRILSFLLAIICLFSLFPVGAFAADGETGLTARISSETAIIGSTVTVKVSIENNPGMSSFKGELSFDESLLTLESIEYNAEFGGQFMQPQTKKSPVRLTWLSPLEDSTYSGTFATLTFSVAEIEEDQAVVDLTMTFDPDDIYDMSETNIPLTVVNGSVTIFNGLPGDINMDQKVNNKDATRLFQYVAGWEVETDEAALDCNGDGKVNNKDATRLFQYVAGWDVQLYYGGKVTEKCNHTMEAHEVAAATCTEDGNTAYWYCTTCKKFFNDATGTGEITRESTILPATGQHDYVNGICKHCGAEQPITGYDYSISYNIAGNDSYLAGLTIENPNPTGYNSGTGVNWLEDLVVPGYTFEGWFDGQGSAASRVTSIPVGTARNITLYAKWTKEVYTITFDNSSMSKASTSRTYTVDQKVTLDKPTIDRYVFLGWTTDSDELVSEIKPGTTGNFTLHSNWTSKRNLAKPVSKLGDPLIIEDTNEGKILFAYEIGQIENVPLYTIKNLPSAGGVVSVYTETTTKFISKTDASTIAKAVDHVTTDSTAWTLSEDWNSTTHVEDSVLEEHGYNRTTGQEVGKTSSNTYTLTTNEYDNTVVKANDGTVATTTQYNTNEVDTRETWESKANLSVSDTESVKYTDSAKVSAEVGVGYGPVSAKVGASAETSTEISSSTTAGASAETTIAHENTSHSKTGTDTVTVEDKTKTTTSDKGWNKAETSSGTSTSSFTQYEEQTLSENIAKTYTYGQSYASGGANSKSADWSTSTGESNQYSSTVTYFNSEETTEGVSYTINGESDGSYRLVRAGIVHVFAVVIYDIANAEYSVATYDVLDDETYTYIDYSATSAAKFDDNENGVLPFEIPYFVNDYVNGRIVSSEGLQINNMTGKTGKYEGSNTSVIVPEYISVDNKDNTHSAVTVRGLSADTFKEKANIKSVLLSNYIREIPDYAFADCTSLQFVLGSEISSIGSYAFDGCSSLGTFKVASSVTSIGENAFRGVDSIEVTASSLDVVRGAIQSGAKHITINISAINEELENVTLEIPNTVETFELQGGKKTFNGLKIKSDAGTTILNGITIKESTSVPLTISSENVTLNQVTVEAPNYVLLLKSNAPTIKLYGTSVFNSDAENAMVCRNVTFTEIKSNVTAQLEVTGNVLCYGTPVNASLLRFIGHGEIISLTSDEFEKYIKGSVTIALNANGGFVETDSITAYLGSAIGTLPTPSRDYYTFDGWYTAASGGSLVTYSTVFSTPANTILYAHWTLKPTSGWVLASAVPAGAQLLSEKWTYDQRTNTESRETSLSGYTPYGSYWVQSGSGSANYASFPSGFDTESSIYTGMYHSQPYFASESETNRRDVSNSWAGYIYWHWYYAVSGATAYDTEHYGLSRAVGDTKGFVNGYNCKLFEAHQSSASYPSLGSTSYSGSSTLTEYDCWDALSSWGYNGQRRYFRFDYYTCSYTDYYKMFQYYKIESKESQTAVTASDLISNVQHWVQYREK